MKTIKITFLLSMMLLTTITAQAKKKFDISKATLNIVTVVSKSKGSVTYALIDSSKPGTIRFNDVTDYRDYKSIVFNYSQTEGSGGKIVYGIWDKNMHSIRVNFYPI